MYTVVANKHVQKNTPVNSQFCSKGLIFQIQWSENPEIKNLHGNQLVNVVVCKQWQQASMSCLAAASGLPHHQHGSTGVSIIPHHR